MNGAAIGRQEVLHLKEDALNLQSPGYQLEKNCSVQESYHLLESKTMSYHSSDSYFVGKPTEFPHTTEHFYSDRRSSSSGTYSPRHFSGSQREPLDLPVPQFVIDENYVGERPFGKSAKALDLDTRIQLLIKSNALSGVHPIFSELEESEDSNLSDKSLKRSKIRDRRRTSERRRRSFEPEDDPDKPLSRPPSPFLSRATYLFWFNKAIEIKEQAKEQEKALLEIASKKLAINTPIPLTKPAEITPVKSEPLKPNDNCMLQCLLKELSKELKDVVKEEFFNNIIESTALKVLDEFLKNEDDPIPSCTDQSGREEVTQSNLKSSSSTEPKTDPQGSAVPEVPVHETVLNDKLSQLDQSKNHLTENPSLLNGSSNNLHFKNMEDIKNGKHAPEKERQFGSSSLCLQNATEKEPVPDSSIHFGCETKFENVNFEDQQDKIKKDLPGTVADLKDVKKVYLNENNSYKKKNNSLGNIDPIQTEEEKASASVVSENVCAIKELPKDSVSDIVIDTSELEIPLNDLRS